MAKEVQVQGGHSSVQLGYGSCYSAIGDTISCNAPYSATGFRGQLFLRHPPCQVCLWTAIGHFYRKKWGCSSDSLQYHRKHSATGVLLHLSRDRGAISVGTKRMEPFEQSRVSVQTVPLWCLEIQEFGIRPVCSLHFGQKSENFPSFIVKNGPEKKGLHFFP